MASLADLPEIIGFFSYSRDDDEDSHNALSTIRALIQNELRARLGRSRQSLRLWQDQEAIAPGSMWESQISTAVQQSVFFIPIITPRVINSKNCGIEFKRFLDRERALCRDDLMFPILYIDVDELQDETQWRGHPLLEVIGQRQYVDWREYRYEVESPALRRAVANLCTKIAGALRRQPPSEKIGADDRAAVQQQADRAARELAKGKRQLDDTAEHTRKREEDRQRAAAAERKRQEEEAKCRAEQEQAFARAKDADTAAAISTFISTYPESHLAADAQNATARLLARDKAHGGAMASDDPIVLESFLNSYPNGRHADEIRARLRKLQLKAEDDKRLDDVRRRAEAEAQLRKEERERAEQEQAFARAKTADTVAAFSVFLATYPKSHLAGDAQNEKARLHARDEPPPERDPETQRRERQESDPLRDAKSRSKLSRAALEWGAAGAISVALNWVLFFWMASSFHSFGINFIYGSTLGLAAAIMLYRSHLSLGRVAGAGAALTILRGFTTDIFFPLIGLKGLYIINAFPILVLALFDSRIRAPSLWLKVFAVLIGIGLVQIGVYASIPGASLLLWALAGLVRSIVFALIGYEIARRDMKPL